MHSRLCSSARIIRECLGPQLRLCRPPSENAEKASLAVAGKQHDEPYGDAVQHDETYGDAGHDEPYVDAGHDDESDDDETYDDGSHDDGF